MATVRIKPKMMLDQKQRAVYTRTCSLSSLPRDCAIKVQPPLPIMVLMAIMEVNTGMAKETAATWETSFIHPTKYMSAML